MRYKIYPYVGVGLIRFGMTREQVREAVQCDASPFSKTLSSKEPADGFDPLGMSVYYKPPGLCVAVEFWDPTLSPILHNKALLDQPFEEVRHWLCELDPNLTCTVGGVISFKFGVGITENVDLHGHPESVIVFETGYYDELQAASSLD